MTYHEDPVVVAAREAVRVALRREDRELTTEDAADLDLGKTTLHRVKVKHRQQSFDALTTYGDAVALAVLAHKHSDGCEGGHPQCKLCIKIAEIGGRNE